MSELHLVKTDRTVPRLGLSIREGAKSVSLSETAFREILPEIPHLRAGRRVIIPVDALREFLAQRSSKANQSSLLKGGSYEQD